MTDDQIREGLRRRFRTGAISERTYLKLKRGLERKDP